MRQMLADHGGEPAALFISVPDQQLAGLALHVCCHLRVPGASADRAFQPEFLVEPMCGQLGDCLQRAGLTAAVALEQAASAQTAVARVMRVVSQITRDTAGTKSASRSSLESSEDVNASRRAADRVAAAPAVREAVHAASRLASGAQTDATMPELRDAVRALELGDLGADVALLLHQEKLAAHPTGKPLSTQAQAVWSAVHELRGALHRARVRQYESVVPEGVQLGPLIDGVSCGRLNVSLLQGSTVTVATPAQQRLHALMRAWPLLIAIMREVHPRDSGAEMTLLALGRTAFDGWSKTRPDGALLYLTSIFERVEKRYHQEHLRGFQAEHTWAEVLAAQEAKNARDRATEQAISGGAAAAGKDRAAEAAKAKEAAAEAAKAKEAAKAAAPAEAGAPEPAGSKPEDGAAKAAAAKKK